MREEHLAAFASIGFSMLAGASFTALLWLTELPWVARAWRRSACIGLSIGAGILSMVIVEAMSNVSSVEVNPAFMLAGSMTALASVAAKRARRQTNSHYAWNCFALDCLRLAIARSQAR